MHSGVHSTAVAVIYDIDHDSSTSLVHVLQSPAQSASAKFGSGCTRLQAQVRHGALGRGRRKAATGPPGRETRICVCVSAARASGRAAILTATERPPPRRTGRKARALPVR
jgi:hypothetical protein